MIQYGKRCKCGHGENKHCCSEGCTEGCVGVNTKWGEEHTHQLCGCKEYQP